MDQEIRMRLRWVTLYGKTGNAGLTCRRCGISRPTLRKWWNRYQAKGLEGLKAESRRPRSSPQQKVFVQEEKQILALRSERKLGARRIKNELYRNHTTHLSLATIHKVLTRNQVSPLKRKRRVKTWNRYERPIPGERVQMDTCKFFAYKVQEYLMEVGVKFRPVKPRSPHLNGKVERAQKIVLDEFFSTVATTSDDLADQLQEWQHYYNWHRGHGAHNGKTPMDSYLEKIDKTPLWEDVGRMYDAEKERLQEPYYRADLRLRRIGGRRCGPPPTG